MWDCSSTEGIESGIDSDTCDDNSSEIKKRDAQTKFELMNKAEKALTEMFGQLQKKKPPVTTSSPLVSTQYKGAKGMSNIVIRQTWLYVLYIDIPCFFKNKVL